jgi:predicted HAD superfamily Cof-like phosphohydrolase
VTNNSTTTWAVQSNTSAELDTKTMQSQTLPKQSTTLKTNVSFYETAAHEFRRAYELPLGLTISSLKLQQNLIDEEHLEVAHAYLDLLEDITNKRAREHLLKELADLVYVCHQMAAAFGWDLQTAFNRVHASNMSKLGEDGKPIRREDGKILKGPNYFEPSLIDLV